MALENGLVSLPDPSELIDGWFAASYLHFFQIYDDNIIIVVTIYNKNVKY